VVDAGPAGRRVALVTGSADGIMRGVCVSLARRGHAIAANYRPARGNADETLSAVRALGVPADAFAGDVTQAHQAVALVEAARSRFGRIDVLVCGVGPLLVKDVADTTPDEFRAMIDGNLASVFFCVKPVLPIMRAQKFGRIMAFGMTGSEFTMGERHYAAHAAAKSGVVAFVKSLALEEGPNGITCNAICPGDIRDKHADRAAARTQQDYRNPTMRPGTWEDVGDAVAFLASDEASFVNGAVIAVNGGWQGFFGKYSRWP
jgi:3-oxoacyl-[acyl-carrier protein] reductase